MLKNLTRSLGLAALLFSGASHALPIVEADAFAAGDRNAVLETTTGLVWMDFGVNSHLSYNHVLTLLPTEYAGWRLPSAAEVDHLWTSLFEGLPEWSRFHQGFGSLSSLEQDEYFESIFAIFGKSPDGNFSLQDADGNVLDTWTTKSLFGVFMKEPGVSGFVSLDSPYDDVHFSSAMYLEMYGVDVGGWFGTLLVKESVVNAPEPGPLMLLLIAMAGLAARRRLPKRTSV